MLRQLPVNNHPSVLVDFSTGDDAAVYRLGENLSLIQTVDFFPPIVDDPYDYGAIAVANALSDVYAMGGTPIVALNILGYPKDLPSKVVENILKGGADKATEAEVLIVGGHTTTDPEPKYGLAVTGTIETGRHVTNAGAQSGDNLILTKPIGTGIIATAAREDRADPNTIREAISIMSTLNRAASEAMMRVGVSACTDITGYGLVGHLHTVAQASKVSAHLNLQNIPVIPGTKELVCQGIAPAGTRRNLDVAEPFTRWGQDITQDDKLILCDAQTSGGLLIAIEPAKTGPLMEELADAGIEGVIVGEMCPQKPNVSVDIVS